MEKVARFRHQKLKIEFQLSKNVRQTVIVWHYQTAQSRTRIHFFFHYLVPLIMRTRKQLLLKFHKGQQLIISTGQFQNMFVLCDLHKVVITFVQIEEVQ